MTFFNFVDYKSMKETGFLSWYIELIFTLSRIVWFLQSHLKSCCLRNENINIFISYEIYNFNIAVKNTYKVQIPYFLSYSS